MFYWIMKAILTPILRALWPTRVEGIENVPQRGPAILAANHLAFLDSLFLPSLLRRRVTYVAKAEYFDSWKTRWFFTGVGQIPIRREGGDASQGALMAAKEVLLHGGLFGIYPEGTRSPDGRLHRGRTGVARLALETGAPLVPVGIVGSRDIQPKGRTMPRLRKPLLVRFGTPVDVDKYRSWPDQRRACRALVDELMYEIAQLSGQEYTDRYASRSADGAPPGAPEAKTARAAA